MDDACPRLFFIGDTGDYFRVILTLDRLGCRAGSVDVKVTEFGKETRGEA